MKTASEIAKLHALFLSQDSANWALAAMMCSEGEFEEVVEMEVERMANSEDFEFCKTRDKDMDGFEYEHKLMLGVVFSLFFEWDRHSPYTWAVIERSWECKHLSTDIAWTELKYVDSARRGESTTYWNQDANDSRGKGPCNQYLTTDFKSELEAVKQFWREQLKALKSVIV